MRIPHYAGYIEEDRLETGQTFWVLNAKLKKPFHFGQKSKINVFLGMYNLFDSFQKDLDKGEKQNQRFSGHVQSFRLFPEGPGQRSV